MNRILRRAMIVGIFVLLCAGLQEIAWAAADNEETLFENSIKAAYLLKFGGFVEWPANSFSGPEAPFVIGVLGEDPFGSTLDQIVDRHTVLGRPAALRRFSRIDQVQGVNILYISQSERNNLASILAALSGKSILTVADADMPGVIINLLVDQERVRFDINLPQAERAGLKISSKLLAVAHAVKIP